MLKKSNRLNRAAFSSYFNTGRRAHGTYLTIIKASAPTFLAAVVVSKKVSKKAVERNKARRRLYALLEKVVVEKDLKGVYIILAKPPLSTLTHHEFIEKVGSELGRVIN
jgi:ribonuclease P protein component